VRRRRSLLYCEEAEEECKETLPHFEEED